MNCLRKTFTIAAALLLAAHCAFAQEEAAPARPDSMLGRLSLDTKLQPKPAADFAPVAKGGGTTQLVSYFVGLLVLAGGGWWFIKRGLPSGMGRTGENRLNLLETKMLGNRQFLVVVQYEDSKMLLGVGPGQIQYLCAIESADADLEALIRTSQPPQAVTRE